MENVKYIPGDLVRTKYDIPKKVYTIESVNPKDKEFVDGKITIDGGSIITKECYHGMYNKEWIHFLEPIPLTPQILEANGWNLMYNVYGLTSYTHPQKDIDILFAKEGNCKLYLNDELWLEFKYIHQLQHLLFGLGLDNNLKI